MAGERRFTRIPPESSGDRVGMNAFLEVGYSGATGTFSIGDTVSFVTSGLGGQIAYVRVDSGTTGIIVIDLDNSSRENNTFATATENIQVNAVTIAQAADTGIELYIPKYNLASGDNPLRLQKVDALGAANMRFTEGPAQLDAFGKLRTSQSLAVGEYTFVRDLDTSHMGQSTVSGGTITHDATAGHAVVATTTASGSMSEFRSHLWHPYIPGISNLGMFSLYHGDTGKTNNTRRWGVFDDYNGIFFELNGTTLYAVVRSNVSGSVTETRIAQANWNVDVLDGTGGADNLSGVNLDITNINLYWIDYEWLGAGRVRWGIFIEGQRVTCHTYNHAASSAWAKYGNYPITFENENTGATGSASELRVICCTLHTEGDNALRWSQQGDDVYPTRSSMLVNSTPTYVGSIRTTSNTHDCFILTAIDAYAMEVGNNAAIEIEYFVEPTITTPSYSMVSGKNLEIDTTGTVTSNGALIGRSLFAGNMASKLENQSLLHGAYKSYANGDPFTVAVYATRVDGSTANCNFNIAMTFTAVENAYG